MPNILSVTGPKTNKISLELNLTLVIIFFLVGLAVVFGIPTGDHGLLMGYVFNYIETGTFEWFELNTYSIFLKPVIFLESIIVNSLGHARPYPLLPNLALIGVYLIQLKQLDFKDHIRKRHGIEWAAVSALTLFATFWPRAELLFLVIFMQFFIESERPSLKFENIFVLNVILFLSVSIHPNYFFLFPLFVLLLVFKKYLKEYFLSIIGSFPSLLVLFITAILGLLFMIGTSPETWLNSAKLISSDSQHSLPIWKKEILRYIYFFQNPIIIVTVPLFCIGLITAPRLFREGKFIHTASIAYMLFLLISPGPWGKYLIIVTPLYGMYVAEGYQMLSREKRTLFAIFVVSVYCLLFIGVWKISFLNVNLKLIYVVIAGSVVLFFSLLRIKSEIAVIIVAAILCIPKFSIPPETEFAEINDIVKGESVMSTMRNAFYLLPKANSVYTYEVFSRRFFPFNKNRIESLGNRNRYIFATEAGIKRINTEYYTETARKILENSNLVYEKFSPYLHQKVYLYRIRKT